MSIFTTAMKLGTRVLNLTALVAGLAASGTLFLSSVADFWLYTSEPIQFEPPDSNDSIVIWTSVKLHSGLWRACVYDDGPTVGDNEDESGTYSDLNRQLRRFMDLVLPDVLALLSPDGTVHISPSIMSRETSLEANQTH
ncbi:hypothetical protein LSAT2_018635 [Lamellibrachia satsuma]|nr:hypothetical protein LSAT2_018635 [Lamellibrachia satsuma]